MQIGGECSAWDRWLLQFGGWLSTGILVVDLSALSPELPTLVSLYVSLVHSALLLLEPSISSWEWNFVCWTFKRLSLSLAICPWWTEILLLFTARCYLGSFPSLVLYAGEPSLGFRPHVSKEECPSCWNKYPSGTSAAMHETQPALSCLHAPCQSCCDEMVSSVCPWL